VKNHQLPQRRSIRLSDYDYTAPGAYFITICTDQRACIFGEIVNGVLRASPLGEIAHREWLRLPQRFSGVALDACAILPNHMHGILVIQGKNGETGAQRPREEFGRPLSGSLPTLIRSYKAAVALKINAYRNLPGAAVWQRNYWEHRIRDEVDWNRIREYIASNPVHWLEDQLTPEHKGLHLNE
jgi:REP element-mobilizing transposase RayT